MGTWIFVNAAEVAQAVRGLLATGAGDTPMTIHESPSELKIEPGPGDRIVVRFEPHERDLLRDVRSELVRPGCPPVTVVALGWGRHTPRTRSERPEGAIGHVRLPLVSRDLFDRLAACASPGEQRWRAWQQQVCEEWLERCASDLRHLMRSVTSAIRLYLGAAARGYVAQACVARVLGDVAQGSAAKESAAFLTALDAYVALTFVPAASRGIHSERLFPHFVLLDDLAVQTGWKTFLDELLTAPTGHESAAPIECAGHTALATWSSCRQWLETRQPSDRELLLVDCNLGAHEPSGLAALASIRSRSLELPVVFLTGYDDAQLALWALRAGANGFFAKELFDGADRASLDYFDHFQELTAMSAEAWALRTRVNPAWRQFLEREHTGELDDAQRLALRFAFYLLFSHFDDHPWWLYGMAVSGTPDIATRLGGLVGLAVGLAGGTVPPGVRHGATLDLEQAVESLELRINRLPAGTGLPPRLAMVEPCLPDGCPYEESELQQEGWRPGQTVPRIPVVDAIIDRAGGGGDLGGPIIVLDPQGRENGWFDVAATLWPKQVACFEAVTPQFWTTAARATCVVTELYIPTAPAGLALIEQLKVRLPELSSVVVSFSTLSIDAVRAVRRGALDYVDKAGLLRDGISSDARDSLQKQVRAAQQLTHKLRPLWTQLSALETRELPPALSALSDNLAQACLPGQVSPTKQWGREISAAARFALCIFQVLDIRGASGGAFVPLDQWRTDALLRRADRTASTHVIWLATHVVEQMAQWRYCLLMRHCFDAWRWGSGNAKTTIEIARAIDAATGRPGAELWRIRQGKSKAKAIDVLGSMFEAIRKFEHNLANLERLERSDVGRKRSEPR